MCIPSENLASRGRVLYVVKPDFFPFSAGGLLRHKDGPIVLCWLRNLLDAVHSITGYRQLPFKTTDQKESQWWSGTIHATIFSFFVATVASQNYFCHFLPRNKGITKYSNDTDNREKSFRPAVKFELLITNLFCKHHKESFPTEKKVMMHISNKMYFKQTSEKWESRSIPYRSRLLIKLFSTVRTKTTAEQAN